MSAVVGKLPPHMPVGADSTFAPLGKTESKFPLLAGTRQHFCYSTSGPCRYRGASLRRSPPRVQTPAADRNTWRVQDAAIYVARDRGSVQCSEPPATPACCLCLLPACWSGVMIEDRPARRVHELHVASRPRPPRVLYLLVPLELDRALRHCAGTQQRNSSTVQ
jgi:hypothetical protein